MRHVLPSEAGMPVELSLGLIDEPDGLKILVRWHGLPHSKDSFKTLSRAYDVTQMVFAIV